MEIKVDATELLNWSRKLGDEAIKETNSNLARALNQLGKEIEDSVVNQVAAGQGIAAAQVRRMFDIKKATAGDLWWELDATRLVDTSGAGLRLPAVRDVTSLPAFPPGLLVNIVTAGDVMVEIMGQAAGSMARRLVEVCEKCLQAAEEGPYTIEEVRAMGAHWQGFAASSPGTTNLLHPNCRCTVWPVNAKWGRMRPTTRREGFRAEPVAPKVSPFEGVMPQVITFDDFARRIVESAGTTIMKVLK